MPDPTPLLPLLSLRSTSWSQVLRSGESLCPQMFSGSNIQPGSSAHTKTFHVQEHLCFCVTYWPINLGAAAKKKKVMQL